VVRHGEEQAERDQHQVQEAVPPLHGRPATTRSKPTNDERGTGK
jgi:hypothetical protein